MNRHAEKVARIVELHLVHQLFRRLILDHDGEVADLPRADAPHQGAKCGEMLVEMRQGIGIGRAGADFEPVLMRNATAFGVSPRMRFDLVVQNLIGWGVATGMWEATFSKTSASARLSADGDLEVACATSDIGTGTYTVMTQIAAAAFGLPLERVTFRLGDSTLPVAPIEGGSSHVTTVGSAVEGACEKFQREVWTQARRFTPGFANTRFADLRFEQGEIVHLPSGARAPLATVLANAERGSLEAKYLLLPNLLKQRKYVRATHSAVFCEVRVDEELGTVRVTRVVSAIAAGRIVARGTPDELRSQTGRENLEDAFVALTGTESNT